MNNPIKYLYLIPAGIVICTILSVISSCSADDNPPGGNLPAGKYPMTFTTAVGELVVTRGTVDNNWTGGEEVAIQLGNDAASYGEIKEYKAADDGKLTPVDNVPLYWRNTTETITAWYSATYSATKPTSFAVKENQDTGDNYQASDFLYTTGTHTYNSSGACALVFKHLPTKVVINLTNGDQVAAEEVANATVSIVNQPTTSGTIGNDGTVAVAATATGVIIPNKPTSSTANGYQQTVQALLVPQDIAGKKFIKVTIGTGSDARNYYYTPAADAAALVAGTQYTYNITVKKEGLEVVSTSGTWIDNEQNDPAPSAAFKISLSDFDGTGIPDYKIADASGELNKDVTTGVYTTNHNRITVSFSKDESGTKKIKNASIEVTEGICKQYSRNYIKNEAGVYTCTYTFDIRSDVSLKAVMLPDPQAGDYYYDDGTWSSTLSSTKTCIGVVFKAGAGTNDDVSKYSGKAIGEEISGYVVALKDAIKQAAKWGKSLAAGEASGATVVSSGNTKDADYTGYYDTQTIYTNHSQEPEWTSDYHAFSSILHYRSEAVAPPTSSDWYLPSVSQLVDVCSNSTVKTNLGTAGGALTNNSYWSSSELSNANAWRVQVNNNTVYSAGKASGFYIRTILTF